MCCHGNASSKLQMAWFFLPLDQFLPLWHGCKSIIASGTSFSLFLARLSRLVAKEQSILLTIQYLKRDNWPANYHPVPWNNIHQRCSSSPLSHHPSVPLLFKQSATDYERGKIVSPLHTACITQILSPLRARHHFYVNLNTHVTYIIELTFNWAFLRIPTRSFPSPDVMISNQIYMYLPVTQSSLSSFLSVTWIIYFALHSSFWHTGKLPLWG